MGPKYLRELEGATTSEELDTIILLATLSRFTEGARRVVMGSDRPMGVVVVGAYNVGGNVSQFIWNSAAGRLLGNGLDVRAVFEPSQREGEESVGSRVMLIWNGSIIKTRKSIPGTI